MTRRGWRAAAASLALTLAWMTSVGSPPTAESAQAASAALDRDWRLSADNPWVAWYDPGLTGAYTSRAPLKIKGHVSEAGSLELTVGPGSALDWSLMVVAPVADFRHPITFDSGRRGAWFNLAFGDGGCAGSEGTVELRRVGLDDRGRILRGELWLSMPCQAGSAHTSEVIHGVISWGGPGREVVPTSYSFPPQFRTDWSGAVHVQVPNDDNYFDATLAGPDAGDFQLALYSCGSVCEATVAFRPVHVGVRRAALVFRGQHRTLRVPLEGRTLPGRLELIDNGRRSTGLTSGHSIAFDTGRLDLTFADEAGWGTGLNLSAGYGRSWAEGVSYTDPGADPSGLDAGVSGFDDPSQQWVGCWDADSTGAFTLDQWDTGAGYSPALQVSYDLHCRGGLAHAGVMRMGARRDVTPPRPTSGLRVTADGHRLRWARPASGTTVLRARSGRSGIRTPEEGVLLYAGTGGSVRVPRWLRRDAYVVSAFHVDRAGNPARARILKVR